MKERGMLYSAPMVRALLDGSKTQTRRVVKLPHENPLGQWEPTKIGGELGGRTTAGNEIPVQGAIWHTRTGDCLVSPYGQPEDLLRVRETFIAYGRWETRFSAKKARDEWHFVDMTLECDRRYQYAADNPDVPLAKGRGGTLPGWYTRPAIFMPRAASRILLEIVSVRVERLNECSEADALAEGVKAEPCDHIRLSCEEIGCCGPTAKGMYGALWDQINGSGSWAAKPWVWCIEFKRVTP